MVVRKSSSVELPVGTERVLPWVDDLSRYPQWMPLVHSALSVGDATWDVELRATVGVFARSKRLRMRRTTVAADRVVFERDEDDGRVHAPWTLEAAIVGDARSCKVTMDMSYGGSLWTAGVLDRVLAHHIELGKQGLLRVVQEA